MEGSKLYTKLGLPETETSQFRTGLGNIIFFYILILYQFPGLFSSDE